jgi:hypothetical protein
LCGASEFCLHAAYAAEVPGRRGELIEENLLQRAFGADLGLKLGV